MKAVALSALMFGTLVALSVVGCRDSREEFKKMEEQMEQDYCSPNGVAAERALLKWKQELSKPKLRESVPNIDVDFLLAITSARLALLSEHKKDTVAFKIHVREAGDYTNRSRTRRGNPSVILSEADVRKIVQQADSELKVKWKL